MQTVQQENMKLKAHIHSNTINQVQIRQPQLMKNGHCQKLENTSCPKQNELMDVRAKNATFKHRKRLDGNGLFGTIGRNRSK